jgi:PLP dependent protein
VRASNEEVLERLARIRVDLERAAVSVGRDPGEVTLVAAAKTVRPEVIRNVVNAGVTAVGQNYVQELSGAREELEDLPVRWHYIGTLQTSTAHRVADLSDVVETVASERAARRLAGRAERAGRIIETLIEVDLTDERAGVRPRDLSALVEIVAPLPGLRLRGLMTMPPIPGDPEDARPWFVRLRELRDGLREDHPEVLDLSMGMSLDYRVAVEEGATMIRIGTALFGERTP